MALFKKGRHSDGSTFLILTATVLLQLQNDTKLLLPFYLMLHRVAS